MNFLRRHLCFTGYRLQHKSNHISCFTILFSKAPYWCTDTAGTSNKVLKHVKGAVKRPQGCRVLQGSTGFRTLQQPSTWQLHNELRLKDSTGLLFQWQPFRHCAMTGLPCQQLHSQASVSPSDSLTKLAVGWPSHRLAVPELAVPELAQPQAGDLVRAQIHTPDVAGAARHGNKGVLSTRSDSWKM